MPPLAGRIEERIHRNFLFTGRPEKKEWLTTFGTELRRVEFDKEEDTQPFGPLPKHSPERIGVCTLGLRLFPTSMELQRERRVRLTSFGSTTALYVSQLPKAKLARRVPEEIGKAFGWADIKAALDYGFERSPNDVREYLEENFNWHRVQASPRWQVRAHKWSQLEDRQRRHRRVTQEHTTTGSAQVDVGDETRDNFVTNVEPKQDEQDPLDVSNKPESASPDPETP